MIRSRLPRIALVAMTAAAFASSPASARVAAPTTGDALSVCQRAVSRIGAQMSHTLEAAPDGGDLYVFVIRSEGSRYTVRCDGRTGSLGEVERVGTLDRMATSGSSASGD